MKVRPILQISSYDIEQICITGHSQGSTF